MARGDIVTIANGATALRPLADAAQSLVVNNRNNGLVYVAADELPTVLFFDYIVPPNSSARLPGVFRETVGVLYQDLSGAGTAGQVELYRSNRVVDAPEYGPLGATAATSFANVDLAQVATPSAPASGFSRLFASAVDQQLWYELPSGVLIPVSQQTKLQLSSIASTDLATNVAIAANTFTDVLSPLTFTVDDANSIVEVSVVGNIVGPAASSTAQIASKVVVDGAYSSLGGDWVPINANGNFLSGGAPLFLTGLAAGSHTLKLQIVTSAAGTWSLRASGNSTYEALRIQVREHKR